MRANERAVIVYTSLEPGQAVVMPVSSWAAYLRYFADLIENAAEHNTFIADMQSDGHFKLTGVSETVSEMLERRDQTL